MKTNDITRQGLRFSIVRNPSSIENLCLDDTTVSSVVCCDFVFSFATVGLTQFVNAQDRFSSGTSRLFNLTSNGALTVSWGILSGNVNDYCYGHM